MEQRTRIGYLVGGRLKENFRVRLTVSQQASQAHGKENGRWKEAVTHDVITLLRDDYPTLMSVLGALSDVSV